MRGLQTLAQRINFGLHGAQLILVSVTAIISVVTLVQTGSLSGHLWLILSLSFVSLPIVLYQLITPTWFTQSRFASPIAYVVTDIGLALLWCGNLLTLVVWEAQGKCQTSKSALQHNAALNSTTSTGGSLSNYLAKNCPTTQSFIGRSIILCVMFGVTSVLNVKARRQHRALQGGSQTDVSPMPTTTRSAIPWMSGEVVKASNTGLSDPPQPMNHFADSGTFEHPSTRASLQPMVTSTPHLSIASELRSRKDRWSSFTSKRTSSSASTPRAQSLSSPRPAGPRTLKSILARQSSSVPPEDAMNNPFTSPDFGPNIHTVTPDGVHLGRLVSDWGTSSRMVDIPIHPAPEREVLTVQTSPREYVTPSALSPTVHNYLPGARTPLGGTTRYYRQSSVVSNKQKRRDR